MSKIWNECESLMEKLSKQKQDELQQLVEELTQDKLEKIAEAKYNFDPLIRKLEQKKEKERADELKKERD